MISIGIRSRVDFCFLTPALILMPQIPLFAA